MFRTLKFIAIIATFWGASVYAADFRRAKTFEDAWKASCRVSVANARGTGTFIGYDKEKGRCIVLTNYHVVTNNTNTTLDFWTNGVRQSVSGKVYARFYDAKKPYDFALIEVNPDELAKIAPPYVAPGGKGTAPDSNSYILSAGCPKGRFVQAWKGKVLGYYNGATVEFQPAPVPGQSGSGVLSMVDGQLWLTAVLTWLIGQEGADSSKGGAIPIANLYDALKGGGASNAAEGDGFSPIPEGAVECAAKRPYVVEITRDNCTPCENAKEDAAAIKASGISLIEYNASTTTGQTKAAEKNVKSAPCFIVYYPNGEEKSRYYGAGKSASIIADIAAIEEETPLDSLTDNLFDVDLVERTPKKEEKESTAAPLGDFRSRAPVYEYEDELENAGFFDDADSAWRLRRGGEEPKQQEPPQYVAPPSIDESKLGDRLGERLRNGLSNSLNAQLADTIDLIEKRIDKRVNSKIEDAKKELSALYNKAKWRLCAVALAIAILGSIIARFIVGGAVTAYKWAMGEDEEQSKEETS